MDFLHTVKQWVLKRRYLVGGVCLALGLLFLFRVYIGVTLGNAFFGGGPVYNVALARDFYAFADVWNRPLPRLAFARGRVAFIQGDFDRALTFFDTELKYFPDTDQAYYMKGLTLGFMGREREGIEAFSEFVRRHPDNWPSRNDLAWLYFRIGAIIEARRTIEPVVAAYAGTPWVENTYGTILLNEGEYAAAREAFMRGLSTVNDMTPAEWGIAYPGNDPRVYPQGLREMRESFEHNIAIAEEALATNPKTP